MICVNPLHNSRIYIRTHMYIDRVTVHTISVRLAQALLNNSTIFLGTVMDTLFKTLTIHQSSYLKSTHFWHYFSEESNR